MSFIENHQADIRLSLNNVSKYFGHKCILKNITLSLTSGTIIAVIGENGSGKTSLSNILSGFWNVTSGERISVGIARDQVSYLFQSTFLDTHLSIKNNLQIIALMKSSKTTDFFDEVYGRLQSIFKVEFPMDCKIKSLSQGQRRMLEFCIAVDPACELLLLDEPTTHFDIHAKERALEWINNVLEHFTGIAVICTHDSDEFQLCSDYIYLGNNSAKKHASIDMHTYKEIFLNCKESEVT